MAAFDARVEDLVIHDQDGVAWHAFRERLAPGIYRTPDDPTSIQDLPDALIDSRHEAGPQELAVDELR